MRIYDPRIRQPLDRIMKAIQRDRTLLTRYVKTVMQSQRITAENVSDLSFNHLFDDDPGPFGITEWDGWAVRGYFTDDVVNEAYDFVVEMHRVYPFMDNERNEYLHRANEARTRKGLEPFKLPACDLDITEG